MADDKSTGKVEQPFFFEYAAKAREEKIKLEPWILENWATFTCDTDVYIGVYGMTIKAGHSFMLELEADLNKCGLYYMKSGGLDKAISELDGKIDSGELEPENVYEDDGMTVREFKQPVTFSVELQPLKKGEHQITYVEYLMWLAVELETSADVKREIICSAYQSLKADDADDILLEIDRVKAGAVGGDLDDENLPRQDTAKPRYRQDPKTKIARLIGIPEKNAELYKELGASLTVASEAEKRQGKEVEQIVAIEYMGADGIISEGRERLTQLDRQVHQAITSLYVAGNRVVSLIQVCELVYGHSKPTDEQKHDVEECIERQMWTRISIDMSAELKEHKLKRPELLTDCKIEGQMLAVRKITARAANGRLIVAYQLMGEPILYTHALVTGQIITYSVKLLQAPKGMKNTERTMALRQTLIEEIRRAKANKRSRFMKYDTIFKDSGQIPKKGTERSRQMRDVRKFLDMFKEHGEISGWEERTEGRKITGFEVRFPDKKKPGSGQRNRI